MHSQETGYTNTPRRKGFLESHPESAITIPNRPLRATNEGLRQKLNREQLASKIRLPKLTSNEAEQVSDILKQAQEWLQNGLHNQPETYTYLFGTRTKSDYQYYFDNPQLLLEDASLVFEDVLGISTQEFYSLMAVVTSPSIETEYQKKITLYLLENLDDILTPYMYQNGETHQIMDHKAAKEILRAILADVDFKQLGQYIDDTKGSRLPISREKLSLLNDIIFQFSFKVTTDNDPNEPEYKHWNMYDLEKNLRSEIYRWLTKQVAFNQDGSQYGHDESLSSELVDTYFYEYRLPKHSSQSSDSAIKIIQPTNTTPPELPTNLADTHSETNTGNFAIFLKAKLREVFSTESTADLPTRLRIFTYLIMVCTIGLPFLLHEFKHDEHSVDSEKGNPINNSFTDQNEHNA